MAERGSGNFWGGYWEGGELAVVSREVSEALACEEETDAAEGFEGQVEDGCFGVICCFDVMM